MKLQEMLEAVQLDALGMLEGEDRRAFEAAFDAADPAIQAQVRAEQERCMTWAWDASEVEPPAALRERVLGTIHSEIQAKAAGPRDWHDDATLPLTESRPGLGVAAAGVIGRVDARTRTPRVSPAWRASSLGFATAAAVLLAAFFSVTRQMESLKQVANDDRALEAVSKGLGGDIAIEAIFGADTQRFTFAAVPGVATNAAATIFLLPKNNEGRLFVKDLSLGAGQTARVVVLDDHDQIVSEIAEFAMNQKIGTAKVDYEASKGRRLGIAVATAGQPASKADVRLVVRTA
jgi:hypothetical protein